MASEPRAGEIGTDITLQELEAFLAVTETLHFGRAAERMYLSQPRVSRLIIELERHVGGTLFDRTNRAVALTPLGERFRDRVRPPYDELRSALADVRNFADSKGQDLRIGFYTVTAGPVMADLMDRLRTMHPACDIGLVEVPLSDPFGALRRGDIDILSTWKVSEIDSVLTWGPTVDRHPRFLAVSVDHELADRSSVSVEEAADWPAAWMPPPFPSALDRLLIPSVTPDGKRIRRELATTGLLNIVELVRSGRGVHFTVGAAWMFAQEGLNLIPIVDLPPLERALLWRGELRHPLALDLVALVGGDAPLHPAGSG